MVLDKDSCLMLSCLGCHGDDFPRSQRRKDVGVQERKKIRCFVTPDDDWLSGTAWRPMSHPRSRKWRSSVWRLFIVASALESQQVMTQNALHTRTKFKPWKNSERVLRVYRVTCAVSGFLLNYRVKLSLTFLIKWRGAFMCDLSKAAS